MSKTRTRLALPDVVGPFRAYRYLARRDTMGEWGALHIVLADRNVNDASVRFCIADARERGDTLGEACGLILLALTRTQRLKLAHYVGESAP